MLSGDPFVDIHCHLLPGLDDGARSWEEAREMAAIAAANGIATIIATPHQGGSFAHNSAEKILALTAEFQTQLEAQNVAVRVLPGADVRFDPQLAAAVARGEVLTLANMRRHLLLDLPHEKYEPIAGLLADLQTAGVAVILSHPERNQGLLKRRDLVERLVDRGCLMQVTSGSILGTFGPTCQDLAIWMLQHGLVHLVATDAHGRHSRRPLLRRAFERLCELVGRDEAIELCCRNPAKVAAGEEVRPGRKTLSVPPRRGRWFGWKPAA